MKKFVVEMSLFVVVQFVIGLLIVVNYPTNDNGYYAAAKDKHVRLASTASPRLVLVGGSNLAFGLKSGVLQDKLGINVVNMALHARLGLPFMLNEITGQLGRGDVVLISLEYEQFGQVKSGNYVMRALQHRPESINFIELGDMKELADSMHLFLGSIARKSFYNLVGRDTAPHKPYTRDSFNQYGDVVCHYKMDRDVDRRFEMHALLVNERSARRIIKQLNEFKSICESKGASVFFAYPSVLNEYYFRFKPEIELIDNLMSAECDIPRITGPEESIFNENYFYDSIYHLNLSGIDKRTNILVEKLDVIKNYELVMSQ